MSSDRPPSLAPVIVGGRGIRCIKRFLCWSEIVLVPRMSENAKVDALLVRLHAPCDRVAFTYVHPANNVALLRISCLVSYMLGYMT